MGNLVMPKNSADSNEMVAVLEVYKNEGAWVSNSKFIELLRNKLGEPHQEPQAYTKKTQIPTYFGFTTFENLSDNQSSRKITDSGIRFYDALISSNEDDVFKEIMLALETRTFGRNVCGLSSDSDIEPPQVFIRSCLTLGYLTRKEFAYILWRLDEFEESIFEILTFIAANRIKKVDDFDELPNKFLDAKPITALVNWNFLQVIGKDGAQDKILINPQVLSKYIAKLKTLRIFNNAPTIPTNSDDEIPFLGGGRNIIYFGSPGTGKSFKAKIDAGTANTFTTLFHPEYTYSDFVGSYRPVIGHEIDQQHIDSHDGRKIPKPVNYFEFVPGPLVIALSCAYRHHRQSVCLLVDELNRGECASIFGDIFQLLDRDSNGSSEYGITPRPELKKYFEERQIDFDFKGDGKLYFPSNFSLVATMNTSDQSLYPIDAAFKRRWEWLSCPIDFDEIKKVYPNSELILNDGIKDWSWERLLVELNKLIIIGNMEDKQIGPWFIKPSIDSKINYNTFLNKFLFYLWHDVYKDDQSSNESPFKLEDGLSTFGAIQNAMKNGGLEAGFKKDLLQRVSDPSLTKN